MKYKAIGEIYRDESGTYRLQSKEQLKAGLPPKVFDKCKELGLVKEIKKEVKDGNSSTA